MGTSQTPTIASVCVPHGENDDLFTLERSPFFGTF